jgi:hypothetical protein
MARVIVLGTAALFVGISCIIGTGTTLAQTGCGNQGKPGGPRGTEASAFEFVILAVLFIAFARAYPKHAATPGAGD